MWGFVHASRNVEVDKDGGIMKCFAFLLYGGPDQLMPLTSGLTAIFAFLLIFWNKVLFLAGRMLNFCRPKKNTSKPDSAGADGNPATIETRSESEMKAARPS
jgi:hypothetical protein